MIKINISEEQKEKIEKIIWNDAITASTGILKELIQNRSAQFWNDSDKFHKLYNLLYDDNGKVREDELKKLLLSSKKEMKKYIDMIGEFQEKEGEYLLEKIFKFDNFSKRKAAYKVLRIIDIAVCPYCNREYIMTIKSGKVKAQLDHYYPKKKYPYLALSIFNLVPCCSICNTAKSNLDTAKDPILYPYEDEFGYDISFDIKVKDDRKDYVKIIEGISDEFEIVIKNFSKDKKAETDRQIERLHLGDLYNEHKSYVKDLLRNRYINTPKRIEEILNTFPKLFNSGEELKNVLYMSDIRKENWHMRPLAKLTYDIDQSDPE